VAEPVVFPRSLGLWQPPWRRGMFEDLQEYLTGNSHRADSARGKAGSVMTVWCLQRSHIRHGIEAHYVA